VCRDLLDAGYHVALWFEPSAPATAGFVAAHLDFPLLQSLSRKFNLDSAESTLLLLLALQEIDPPTEIPRCPRIRTWADFALQFPHLANPRLLLPGNPLRHWNLVQPTRGRIEPLPLAQAPLVLSERILAYLLNDHTPDARLAAALVLSLPPRVLAPPQRELALAIANRWRSATHFTDFQTIALQGQDPDALLAIAGEAASQAGFQLARLNAAHLPASPADRQAWRTLWQTEALLSNLALYLDATAASREECAAAGEWLIPCGGAILLGCQRPASLPATFVHLHAPETRAEDRAELISSLLNGQAPDDPQFARRLAGQFDLGVSAVYRACLETHQTLAQAGPDTDAAQTLWRACRERARPRTGSLTQLIESKVTWEDLILPDTQLALLREEKPSAPRSSPTISNSTSSASTSARSSANTSAKPKSISPRSSTPPSAAARFCSSTKPTRSLALAAGSPTAATDTLTSRSVTCFSASKPSGASRFSPPIFAKTSTRPSSAASGSTSSFPSPTAKPGPASGVTPSRPPPR
jgi:hypothetical protein